jgi:hypothetical protein
MHVVAPHARVPVTGPTPLHHGCRHRDKLIAALQARGYVACLCHIEVR